MNNNESKPKKKMNPLIPVFLIVGLIAAGCVSVGLAYPMINCEIKSNELKSSNNTNSDSYRSYFNECKQDKVVSKLPLKYIKTYPEEILWHCGFYTYEDYSIDLCDGYYHMPILDQIQDKKIRLYKKPYNDTEVPPGLAGHFNCENPIKTDKGWTCDGYCPFNNYFNSTYGPICMKDFK